MPRHYALGKNVQQYTAVFDNTKVVQVYFDAPFDKKPIVQLTMDDSGALPAFKQKVTKEFVKVKFQENWTGEVDILVLER